MKEDKYIEFAEKYDYMMSYDDARTNFFRELFEKNQIESLLDCSCGTGNDLIIFSSMVKKVTGSDLSDAMLAVARKKIEIERNDISLKKADFRNLAAYGLSGFDGIVCLSSSICEIHDDENVIKALKSMYESLNSYGILIIDQGQSDAMMKSKPRFIPVLNNEEISRLFVIDYLENSNDFITVNICDLIHDGNQNDFSVNPFRLRIRLIDEWKRLLEDAGIKNFEIYGNWDKSEYDKNRSKRLIIKAKKE
jgi:ubiquinone/menaquinone biosynthesis C-methylase UbiE